MSWIICLPGWKGHHVLLDGDSKDLNSRVVLGNKLRFDALLSSNRYEFAITDVKYQQIADIKLEEKLFSGVSIRTATKNSIAICHCECHCGCGITRMLLSLSVGISVRMIQTHSKRARSSIGLWKLRQAC
jgi:hypothetical protein